MSSPICTGSFFINIVAFHARHISRWITVCLHSTKWSVEECSSSTVEHFKMSSRLTTLYLFKYLTNSDYLSVTEHLTTKPTQTPSLFSVIVSQSTQHLFQRIKKTATQLCTPTPLPITLSRSWFVHTWSVQRILTYDSSFLFTHFMNMSRQQRITCLRYIQGLLLIVHLQILLLHKTTSITVLSTMPSPQNTHLERQNIKHSVLVMFLRRPPYRKYQLAVII